ncbi:hypothetical protein Tco_0512282 [Tanacetum coccineum]
MRRLRWDTITQGIDAYFAKRYGENKYNMKRDYWNAKGEAPDVDAITRQLPPNDLGANTPTRVPYAEEEMLAKCLLDGIYDIVDRVMHPLALKQTRRTRSDRGKAHHSVSSSSSHRQGTSSHQHDDDDDDDVETSRASTPSPTTYLNSLDPLNYQNYQMPSSSERTNETLFERQTDLLNQTQQMHKEMRGGFKSFGKALKGVFSKKKK